MSRAGLPGFEWSRVLLTGLSTDIPSVERRTPDGILIAWHGDDEGPIYRGGQARLAYGRGFEGPTPL